MQSLQGGLGACRSRIGVRMEGKPEVPIKIRGSILYFSSYHDGVNYQKENHLEQTTYVLPLVDREKELYIAA